MKQPKHYWAVYVVAVLVVLGAMSWLSVKAIELERAELLAQRQAELDESVGAALWRMDVTLMPHLAREAARPHAAYEQVVNAVNVAGNAGPSIVLSPLLTDRSEYVLVNFQVAPGDVWSSPQSPSPDMTPVVHENGVASTQLTEWTGRLNELQERVSYDQLASSLPSEELPPLDSPTGMNYFTNSAVDMQQVQQMQQRPPQSGRAAFGRNQQARAANDFVNRDQAMQSIALSQKAAQMPEFNLPSATVALEGVSQPMWVGSQLLLARRVQVHKRVVIQGCWLDWKRIQAALKAEVADLLPSIELQPVIDTARTDVTRMLATLPVQVVVPPVSAGAAKWSAMSVALATAWGCLLIAAAAAAVLLHGVLSLSERRASFVSAVTHELRTPLTTFRMYSEMLANDMVPDEKKRRRYLDTLRVEADRLSHLVENVLAYARLERGRDGKKRVRLTVAELISHATDRLEERAKQAEMKLVMEIANAGTERSIWTDASAVEQILFNLVDNACKYAAASQDRRIHIDIRTSDNQVEFRVRDHGAGVSAHEAKQLFEPFSKSADQAANSAPGVGLGLALCRRLAKQLGGRLELQPTDDRGATFCLILPTG
jgi:signal transduction histidine kinase